MLALTANDFGYNGCSDFLSYMKEEYRLVVSVNQIYE